MIRRALLLCLLAALAACSANLPDETLIREAPAGQVAALAAPLKARVESHPRDETALRRLAIAEARMGQSEAAVTHALRAVQEQPFRGANQLVLGEAYEVAGKPVRALAAYGQAIALNPNLIDAYVHHARVQASLRERDKALHTLDEALRREPRHFGARLLRARLLREAGRFPDALQAIETARRLRPQDAGALRLHAEILQDRGQLDAATRLVTHGLSLQPDDRDLLAMQARLYRDQGDAAAALQSLGRLETLGPLTPAERLLRVEVWSAQGDEARAAAGLAALLRDEPDFAPAHVRQAERLIRAGLGRDALRDAQQAASLAPQSAEAHYWEAVAHYTIDESTLGDAALEVAARLEPNQQALRLLHIERLMVAYRLDAAEELLNGLLAADPDSPYALLLHSELAVLRGQPELAAQELDRLPPTFAPEQVRFARLRIAYLGADWAQVQALSAPLLQHPLLGWRAAYLRAAALLRQGRWDDGLAVVKPYLEGPQRRVLFFHLAGYLSLLKGDAVQAQRVFLAGLALVPGDPLMIEGLSRLAVDAQDWARAEELLVQGLEHDSPFRTVFLERLMQVSRARKESPLSRETLLRFLGRVDPSRGGAPAEPASSVLYGAYFPPYDLRPGG